jgi:hypothetical protein
MANHYAGFDTTGQNPPPGMKPRVTATLWEDEGSLCFQVEARGICVARREGMAKREVNSIFMNTIGPFCSEVKTLNEIEPGLSLCHR